MVVVGRKVARAFIILAVLLYAVLIASVITPLFQEGTHSSTQEVERLLSQVDDLEGRYLEAKAERAYFEGYRDGMRSQEKKDFADLIGKLQHRRVVESKVKPLKPLPTRKTLDKRHHRKR